MRHIQLWGEIYGIYKKTNRNYILKNNGHKGVFYSCLIVYIAVTVSVSFLKDTYFFTSIVLIFLAAMAISLIFIYTLSKDYASELNGHPLFSKSKYIKYIEFKKHFDDSKILSPEIIPALLEWEEIRSQRFDTVNFFTNPITLIVLSAFLSQLFNSFSSTGKSIEFLVIAAYLFMAVMFISWTAYDFLSSNKKKNFEICRLLRWVQIESKSPSGDI